jgi:hypothetical protein
MCKHPSLTIGKAIEKIFKQRVIDAMKKLDPNYADWMVTVTYLVE